MSRVGRRARAGRSRPPAAGGVVATFADGSVVSAKQAVVATNGLFLNMDLAGLLVPCWSYFVALPHPVDTLAAAAPVAKVRDPRGTAGLLRGVSSQNFFTYGFTHDWCALAAVRGWVGVCVCVLACCVW